MTETQKQLDIDQRVHLTESQYESLKAVAEASGDALEGYLHEVIIQGVKVDIDLYFGHSEAIKGKLYKKLEAK